MVRKAIFVVVACIAILSILLPSLQVNLQRKQYRREMRAWMKSEPTLKRDTIPLDRSGVEVEDANEISIHGVMYDIVGVTWHKGKPSWICVEDSYEQTAFREFSRNAGDASVDATHPGKRTLTITDLTWFSQAELLPSFLVAGKVCLCEKGDPELLTGFERETRYPPKTIHRT